MSNFSLSKFQSEIRARGLAKPNRFEILMNTPALVRQQGPFQDTNLVNLFCESANLPPTSIGLRQQRILGPAYQRPSTIDYGGDGMTMTFLLDQTMNVKAYFDCWMASIVNPLTYNVRYQLEYAVDITVKQLNEQNRPTYEVILTDAFPRSMNMLEVNNASTNAVHKLSVNFAYRKAIPVHMNGYTKNMYNVDAIRNGVGTAGSIITDPFQNGTASSVTS